MVKITGLWKNERNNGEVFYRGNIGNATYLVFENKNKVSPNSPDYELWIAQEKPRDAN